jgi:hypothetical protein
MPIAEIMKWSAGVVTLLAILHGPSHLNQSLHSVEIPILREVTRTDDWGYPGIGRAHGPSRAVPSRHIHKVHAGSR